MDLRGRHAVVTGGSSGLGLGLAKALGERGAAVTLVARDRERLDRAAAELRDEGVGTVRTLSLDIGDAEAATESLGALATEHPIDLLVNSAGIIREGRFADLASDDFAAVLRTNVEGTANATRAALPSLRARRGTIVNIASAAGLMGVYGYTAYCASKYALVGFTEALRFELEPEGVTVQIVCPPEFDSPMVDALERERTPENRAHVLSVPKLPLATVVAETIDGIGSGRPLIVPGARTRAAVLGARLAPGIARRVAARQIRRAQSRTTK